MPFSKDMRRQAGLSKEDALEQSIMKWKKDPKPAATAGLLNELSPIIDRAIAAHAGSSSPLLRSRARRMAIESLKRYEPGRVLPSTFLFGQLYSLRRVARKQQQIVRVPERIALERGQLQESARELYDSLGREPTDDELADYTGFSVKRIQRVQKANNPMAEGQFAQMGDEENSSFIPASKIPGANPSQNAWHGFVRADLDPVNQAIFDHTLGFDGKPVLSNQQIATRLKLSPGAISQRKAIIQKKLDEETSLSPFRTGE